MRTPLLALPLAAAVLYTSFHGTDPEPDTRAARQPVALTAPALDSQRLSDATRSTATALQGPDLVATDAVALIEAGAAPLFEDVDAAELPVAVVRPIDRTVYRQRFVHMDPARFTQATALEWNLFDDLVEPVVLDAARWKSFDGAKLLVAWPRGRRSGERGRRVGKPRQHHRECRVFGRPADRDRHRRTRRAARAGDQCRSHAAPVPVNPMQLTPLRSRTKGIRPPPPRRPRPAPARK